MLLLLALFVAFPRGEEWSGIKCIKMHICNVVRIHAHTNIHWSGSTYNDGIEWSGMGWSGME